MSISWFDIGKSRFKGLVLYTVDILFHMKWCIRLTALVSFFYHIYNINSIAYNYYTDITFPLLNI